MTDDGGMRRVLSIAVAVGLMALALKLLAATQGGGAFTPPAVLHPPYDDSWSRSGSNPIITADEAWDGDAVVEPCVTYEAGTWKMWYRGGWWTQAIGYATSSDGIAWTKGSNPVYGLGGSGEADDMALPWVYKDGSTYYLFAVRNGFGGGNEVAIATSSDGIDWTTEASSISLPPGTNLWGNVVVWKEGATWQMLHEAAPTGDFWRIYRYTSADGLSWSIANGGAAYGSLALGADRSYGGPRIANINGVPTPQFDGVYHLWYHATPAGGGSEFLPTNIYHATTTDLTTDSWTVTTPSPVLTHAGSGFEVDQVAGALPMVVGATAYLFYDGDDNSAEEASIGVATAPAE